MTLDRQRQFLGRDAAAVVADADQAHAAVFQIDVDPPGAGIDGVLDQFLHHRRRAFDDFAGSDLVDEGVGQLADRHVVAVAACAACMGRTTMIARRSTGLP
jgi:hypothetical protein